MRIDNPSNIGFYAKISDKDEYAVVHLLGDINNVFPKEEVILQNGLLREKLKKGHLSFTVLDIDLFELYQVKKAYREKDVQLVDLGNVEYQKLIKYAYGYATAYNDAVDLGIIAKKPKVEETYKDCEDEPKDLEAKLKEIGTLKFSAVFYGRITDAEDEIYTIKAYSFNEGILKMIKAERIGSENLGKLKKSVESKGVDAVYVGGDTAEQLPVKISEVVDRYIENISLKNRKTTLGDDLAKGLNELF